jgi:hypothetical protein
MDSQHPQLWLERADQQLYRSKVAVATACISKNNRTVPFLQKKKLTIWAFDPHAVHLGGCFRRCRGVERVDEPAGSVN